LGFGSIKVKDFASLHYSLYLAPLVALLFDIMSMGHTFAIRRNGKFLRQNSPSDLERRYELLVCQNRDIFIKISSFVFNLLAFPAAILLVKAATDKYPTKIGWLVLSILFVSHITLFIICGRKIKDLDINNTSKNSNKTEQTETPKTI